ncbi:MAG: glycerol-3-phosphate dehydrogenase/oxidase, partial [Microbacterium sp.]|uniref:glycerol-3-phosphate dehydrogenase/oxidase n=1 Tax=Microbacterium sp. TaxID=51671 RepID=UPI003A8A3C8B
KLVHGGLRYLASGQFGIAHESAAERHVLMTRTAPHLTRPLAQGLPLFAPGHRYRGAYVGAGYLLGDALRRVVGTPGRVLPPPGVIGADEVLRVAPAVRGDGLRGAIRGWDGRLVDDARLVVAVARTAAGFGARVLTRVAAVDVTGNGATLRDELTGQTLAVRARAVLNAAGVWAGQVDASVRLRPSRGTHLVLDAARFGGSDVSLTVPLPGSRSRMVFTLPAPHGRVYAGLTDVPVDGPVPDVAEASEEEITMLLDTVSLALEEPLGRSDVLGSFAGLRPLLVPEGDAGGATSDISRQHAILESASGVFSVVGGKLTTYRRMAQDGVDAAIAGRGLVAPASRTRDLGLVGAWPRARLATLSAPARYVRRYGTEASAVAALPGGIDAAHGVTAQELAWGVIAEGALTIDDLLDRRTRLGLVAGDRAASIAAAEAALDAAPSPSSPPRR